MDHHTLVNLFFALGGFFAGVGATILYQHFVQGQDIIIHARRRRSFRLKGFYERKG